jgi:hypothetical protein
MIVKRVRLLATVVAVSAALVLTAGAASAATLAEPALAGGALTHSAVIPGKAPLNMAHFRVTETITQPKVNLAINCGGNYTGATVTLRYYGTYFGAPVWWVQMTTNFCYNYNIVTYHVTTMSDWVAGSYHYQPAAIQFSCYAQSGHPNCSGNVETDSLGVYYLNGSVGYKWDLTIRENEYFDGGWYKYWHVYSYGF